MSIPDGLNSSATDLITTEEEQEQLLRTNNNNNNLIMKGLRVVVVINSCGEMELVLSKEEMAVVVAAIQLGTVGVVPYFG
jgi:hypothetical protein